MTEIARRPRPRSAVTPYLEPGEVELSGDRAGVLEQLRDLRQSGRLVKWRNVPAMPGSAHVIARVRPAPEPEPVRSDRRWWLFGAGVGIGLGAIGTVAWLLHTLVVAIANNIVALVGIAAVVVLVLGAIGRQCVTTVTVRHRH